MSVQTADRRTGALSAHQEVLFELLCEIDRVCREEEIPYMLFAGTALGAVREGGFIPWDDDLDVILLRRDYERFLSSAQKRLDPKLYYVQKEGSAHWPLCFSKLRKNGTACIERYIPKDYETHQGIYADIFPCDGLSDHRLIGGLQYLASKIVIAKALDARGYLTDSLIKKLFIAFCRLLPAEPFRRFAVSAGGEGSRRVHTFFAASSRYSRSVFPRSFFEKTVRVPFNGRAFPVSAHSEELLEILYGDFRTPTPEEERGIKIHAEIVDTEHSYEEYREMQEKLRFHEYTRSIR